VGDLYHEAEVGADHLLSSRSIATFNAFPKALLIRTSQEGDIPNFAEIGTESTVTEIGHG
jgi:hypothetical protein